MINIGCGKVFNKEWLNFDLQPCDISIHKCNIIEGIPLNDNFADAVYHSNILEHLSKNEGINFLQECYRVIKKNGIIRIAIPDLEQLCINYLHELEKARKCKDNSDHHYEWSVIELIDQMTRSNSGGEMESFITSHLQDNKDFLEKRIGDSTIQSLKEKDTTSFEQKPYSKRSLTRNVFSFLKHNLLSFSFNRFRNLFFTKEERELISTGEFYSSGEIHKWMYDSYSLSKLLTQLGFININMMKPGDSLIPNWQQYHLEIDINSKVIKPDSIIIEAIKK